MKHTLPMMATVAAFGVLASDPAAAQTRCGPSYEMEPDDTLYQVTQQCRVTMSRIMDLNPGIDPRDVEVGTRIRLAADGGANGGPPPGDESYAVKRGDTLYSIAQTLGYSVFELLNANADIDPFDLQIGQVIDLPGEGPEATVRLAPDSGRPGEQVMLRASGLRPNDWVTLGVGPRASEWREIGSVRVAPDGGIAEEVDVPDWADAGDDLIFVVDTDRGVTFKSGVFDVTGGSRPGDGGGNRDEDGGMRTLEGRVSEGVECLTLETSEGDVWSIIGGNDQLAEGDYVKVQGERAEASFCMQGVGTLEVSDIAQAEPPRDGD